jgi:hypothetical protein
MQPTPEAAFQATSDTKVAHMANNPKAIPVASDVLRSFVHVSADRVRTACRNDRPELETLTY